MSEKIKKPEASPQDAKELYEQTVRLFGRLEDGIVVTPGGNKLVIENLDIPLLDNKRAHVSRARPRDPNDPEKAAANAPLEIYDASGNNVYHTPVAIEVYDQNTGELLHDYIAENQIAPLGGELMDARVTDYAVEDAAADGIQAVAAKELIAQLEQAMSS